MVQPAPCKTCGLTHAGEGGTPGPWRIDAQERQIDIRGGDGAAVAQLRRGYLGQPLGAADANARLIVQAPNLLAVLKEAVEGEDWDAQAWAHWQSDAEAAIEAVEA